MKKLLSISIILLLTSCTTLYIKPTYSGITQKETKTKKVTPIGELFIIALTINLTF